MMDHPLLTDIVELALPFATSKIQASPVTPASRRPLMARGIKTVAGSTAGQGNMMARLLAP
jgi:hypothetical protein